MSGHPKPATWAEAVRQVHEEAAGVLSVVIVRQCDAVHLALDALSGDDTAAALLLQVNDCIQRIEGASARNRTQCGCCGANLASGRYAVVIASPDVSDPSAGLGMAICRRCGPTVGAIKAAAMSALRLIWPDLRPVQVTHPEGGRA